LVFSAFCAGTIAGLMMGAMHLLVHVPLIVQAEVYEEAAATQPGAALQSAPAAGGAHVHDAGPSGTAAPDARMRGVLTLIADVLAGIGFALLLCAGMALRDDSPADRRGIGWGLGGFCSFALAPAVGLPPQLPGAEAAALVDRELWWLATASATAGGLALIVYGHRLYRIAAGVALIALPHVIGAPRPPPHVPVIPEGLARSFVLASLGTNLLFWSVLGLACAVAMRRFAPHAWPPGR
jgi:cobalt transporter subunit CbtA